MPVNVQALDPDWSDPLSADMLPGFQSHSWHAAATIGRTPDLPRTASRARTTWTRRGCGSSKHGA